MSDQILQLRPIVRYCQRNCVHLHDTVVAAGDNHGTVSVEVNCIDRIRVCGDGLDTFSCNSNDTCLEYRSDDCANIAAIKAWIWGLYLS